MPRRLNRRRILLGILLLVLLCAVRGAQFRTSGRVIGAWVEYTGGAMHGVYWRTDTMSVESSTWIDHGDGYYMPPVFCVSVGADPALEFNGRSPF